MFIITYWIGFFNSTNYEFFSIESVTISFSIGLWDKQTVAHITQKLFFIENIGGIHTLYI